VYPDRRFQAVASILAFPVFNNQRSIDHRA
jgi:hypothetical protein